MMISQFRRKNCNWEFAESLGSKHVFGSKLARMGRGELKLGRSILNFPALSGKKTHSARKRRKRPKTAENGRPAGRSLRERDRDTVSLTLTDPKMGFFSEVRDGTGTGRIVATRAIIWESLAAIRRNRGTTANNGNINGWPAGPP